MSATKYVIIIIIIAPHALFRVRASVSRDRYLKGALATRIEQSTSHHIIAFNDLIERNLCLCGVVMVTIPLLCSWSIFHHFRQY